MDAQTLTAFFMWCTVLNGGLLVLWSGFFMFAPDLVYRIQSRWVAIPRETFDVFMYGFLALFKILFIVFNLVPWLALLILQ